MKSRHLIESVRFFVFIKMNGFNCEAIRNLRTLALIVSAHPFCARNSRRHVMPRHALSARAVEVIDSASGHFSIYARV